MLETLSLLEGRNGRQLFVALVEGSLYEYLESEYANKERVETPKTMNSTNS